MFFTRSIRRKMVTGWALVFGMLIMLALSGITGLYSYRSVVRQLDYSINEAPRRSDLVAAVSPMFEPLLVRPDAEQNVHVQQQMFLESLETAEREMLGFRSKLESMDRSPGIVSRQHFTSSILNEVDFHLFRLKQLQTTMTDPQHRAATVQQMLAEVASIQTLVQRVPDPQEGMNETLAEARDAYRSRLTLVIVLSGTVVILFIGLILGSYHWVFGPIRKLHQGARRVAQEDFDYRLQLNSNDEMAELAEAFNQMTARFQEIKSDLDQQVDDRSKQLVRSERLANVGVLAAGVAHEINNPLSALVMAAESLSFRSLTLLEHATEDEKEIIQEYLGMLQTEAKRCKTITDKLLTFARGQETPRMQTNLNELVGQVLSMVQHLPQYKDRTVTFEPGTDCLLEVNGAEIKQVILNLVANALESTDPGGKVDISMTELTDHLILRFHDDGCGMTEEIQQNLFEPFYTKNKSGKGTGLGLSISHQIITEHGGTIKPESVGPGQGSTFEVRLPRRCPQERAA